MGGQLLEMQAITKGFGPVKALDGAAFTLERGEIHALLGVNGAGKSTLIKVLSGVYPQDAGSIWLDGTELALNSPKAAKKNGIYCVYQEVDTALIADLSVAENILLDSFAAAGPLFVSKRKIRSRAREVLSRLQSEHIDVEQKVSQLSLADKQLVLIARALVHSAKIIIFDEPTAPLSVHEADKLFSVIRSLSAQGVGCIFISHRLPEVFELCSRITVMRDGRHVAGFLTAQAEQQEVVEAMLGRALSRELQHVEHAVRDTLLTVENLSDTRKLKEISFTAASGEVVGIVGLVGAGKSELAKALFGAAEQVSGKISLGGQPLRLKHSADAIKSGIALIPEERRKEGLFVHESLEANASFPNLRKFSGRLFMNKVEEQRFAHLIIDKLKVKTSDTTTPLTHLSGGNQQKVAIGKWMSLDSRLYLFDEPTKGVDIGAKVDIFHLIRELAESGKSCLYFTSEIQEALGISDRILVMCDGRIVKELTREQATQERILLYASGGEEAV
ncbi:sugar ABC transporter ATP-binding protein [Planococcus sp. SSTMD024]|uniref:sugar ABC transporter ATP-binding protein n=1 Tax=Planococcus sp. SSTMD024 TaxID=3242163 RepID=UPI00351E7522